MTSKKRGLGKGLSALIGENTILDNILEEEIKGRKDVRYIALDLIVAKEDQPRKDFDEEALSDLSKSIEVHGVIQPILLKQEGDKYEIIAGERRYRASRLANLKEIPSIIMDVDSENAAKLALIENIQREDLNPIEEATAYKQLMKDFKLKQDELAKTIGKSRAYISNSLRLLNLEDEVVGFLHNGQLTTGHGKVLLGIKDPKEQVKLAHKIIDTGLNVRDTEAEVKGKRDRKINKVREDERDPYMVDLEERIMMHLGTRVRLFPGDKKGKIEIEYYGNEDLERLIDIFSQ